MTFTHKVERFAACAVLALAGMGIGGSKLMLNKPKLELLMFDGCPNSPKMKLNLLAALKALRLSPVLAIVDIQKLPVGDVRKGYGAPTVLVNGKDLFGHREPRASEALPSCRLYPGGVPSTKEIKKRLNETIAARG